MKECRNCKYARKAYNKDYLGCVAALSDIKEADEFDNYLMAFYQRKDLAYGWVYLKCAPDMEDKVFGLCTNGIPVFKPDDCCRHFKEREN